MTKVAQLEALLFTNGGEVKKTTLMDQLGLDTAALTNVINTLTQLLSGHGVALVQSPTSLALRTSPSVASFINDIYKKSLGGDLGKAGLEVLSILFYKGSSSKTEIDYIRGVNSATSIRALLVRGLINREKKHSSYIYSPTIDALALLGVEKKEDLPEFDKMCESLQRLDKDSKVAQLPLNND